MTPKQLDKAEMHLALRAGHWAFRIPQMLENIERRPYWQFRTVGDSQDPPDCQVHDGRIERYDSGFWRDHSPANCRRLNCRCTIRPYGACDLTPDCKHVLPRD